MVPTRRIRLRRDQDFKSFRQHQRGGTPWQLSLFVMAVFTIYRLPRVLIVIKTIETRLYEPALMMKQLWSFIRFRVILSA